MIPQLEKKIYEILHSVLTWLSKNGEKNNGNFKGWVVLYFMILFNRFSLIWYSNIIAKIYKKNDSLLRIYLYHKDFASDLYK